MASAGSDPEWLMSDNDVPDDIRAVLYRRKFTK